MLILVPYADEADCNRCSIFIAFLPLRSGEDHFQ